MKTFTRAALTGVGVSVFFFASCTKNDLDDQAKKKPKKNTVCDVSSFAGQYDGGESGYIFSKSYNMSGTQLSRIDAGLYSGGAIWKTVSLDISYNGNLIYFVSAQNSTDTGLVVHLDNSGRVAKADVGQIIDDGFGPQEFFYENNRLSLVNIDDNWMRIWFRYDSDGNNTQIVTDSSGGVARINHVYQYAKKPKVAQQFYLDEARGFSFNVLTILHAAGFFPELNPVHARVRSTVTWGGYVAYDYAQINHVTDKDGRLLQYQTASPGSKSPVATYTVNYNCASGNGNNQLITYAQ